MRRARLLIAMLVVAASVTGAQAGVIGYWRFEEGTADTVASGAGSVLDSSVPAYNGTPSGGDGPVYRSDVGVTPVPITGQTNALSLEFDGINDYVDAGNDSAFDLTHKVTAEAFFKPTGNPAGGSSWRGLVTKSAGWAPQSSYQLYYNKGGQGAFARVRLDNDTYADLAGSPSLLLDEWYHAALVVDIDGTSGGTADLYVTGMTTSFSEHKTTNIGAGRTMKSNTAAVQIGAATNEGIRHFDGLIDEARISDVALSPNQFLNFVPGLVDAPLALTQRIHDTDFDGNGNQLSDVNIVAGEYDAGGNWEDRAFAVFELPDLAPAEFIKSATLKLYLSIKHDSPNPADLYHLQTLNRDNLVISDFEALGDLVASSFVQSSDPLGWYEQDVLSHVEDDYANDPAAARYAAFRIEIQDFLRQENGQSERYWFHQFGHADQPVLTLQIGVPEPSTALLAGMGLVGLALCALRRRRE